MTDAPVTGKAPAGSELHRSELRSLVRLAAPILLVQLGQFAMGFVDAAMVGRVSKEALAAVALGNLLMWGLFAGVVFGFGTELVLVAGGL